MIESDPQQTERIWGTAKPVPAFAWLAVGLLGAICLSAELLFQTVLIPGILFVAICGLSLRGLMLSYPHHVLGFCNVTTLVRAAMVAVLAGALFGNPAPWAVFLIATVAFALDGVDGWLARRAGLSSAFGARFDMEIDALLGAVLALVLLLDGNVGPAILILGFSRYAFVAAGFVWPALKGDLPESFRRKAICVVQIAALIILLFPLTPTVLLLPVSILAACALAYSFAVDAIYLLRRAA